MSGRMNRRRMRISQKEEEEEEEKEMGKGGVFWLISKASFPSFVFFLWGTLCPCRLK